MKTEHSPAPWRIEGPYLRSADGYNVAVLYLGPDARDQSNRDLILSAPDLLAQRDELRNVLTEILKSVDADNRQEAMLCALYRQQARAALAKCELKGPQ